ncbi:MAG TPA: dihydrodipicolinate synthase family protein [Tepidisphaeraceae bacterium]|jgi:N-acetylneuraminate lyase|nr:dihydrodipicolinate synthase family protein [Tepidisphaeraceae bacterium]
MICPHITGLVAAPHTPMRGDGELFLPAVEQQAAVLVKGGVSAAFVCGTTGEGMSLSTPERMQVAARWMEAAPRELPVIVHVGHASVAEARALAAHAQSIGALAISALAPYFFKPNTIADLVDFCARVASAAPGIPFYYYHLPTMTGVSLSMVDFIQSARDAIPTFAGLKYTHNDLVEFQRCLQIADGKIDILFGRDELLLSALEIGAVGAVGSTYNYAAPIYRRLQSAYRAGDFQHARDCQKQVGRLVAILRRYGEIAAAKAIMQMMGVECGPPRSPLRPLDRAQTAALYEDVREMDIFVRPLRAID